MKKYQTGGSVGSKRDVLNALRNIQTKQQTGRTMGDIFTKKVMGEAREKLQREVEEWQEKIRKQQEKSRGS